eukprot:403356691
MDKSSRDTDIWLRQKFQKEQDHVGPGYYDFKTKVLKTKESFNFGKIPFGSSQDRSAFQVKGPVYMGKSLLPGPGQYDYAESRIGGDLSTTISRNLSFKQSNTSSFKSRSPKLSYMASGISTSQQRSNVLSHNLPTEASSFINNTQSISLIGEQKQKVSRIRNKFDNDYFPQTLLRSQIDSSTINLNKLDAFNQSTIQEDDQIQSKYQKQQSSINNENVVENQNSAQQYTTYISSVKTVFKPKVSGGKSPTKNNFNNLKVANQNFDMFQSPQSKDQSYLGPGLYDPNHSLVMKHSPSVKFGGVKQSNNQSPSNENQNSNSQSLKKQVEGYLQNMLGKDSGNTINFDDRAYESNKRRINRSFDIHNNQSFVFASTSNRTNFANSQTPGPGTYIQQNPVDLAQRVKAQIVSSRVNFGSFSDRNTDVFMRNPKFPFNKQSFLENPSMGTYEVNQHSDFSQTQKNLNNQTLSISKKMSTTNFHNRVSKRELSPFRKELIELVKTEKKQMMTLPGPGQYDPKTPDSEIIKQKIRNPNKVIPFSSQTPRFKQKKVEIINGDTQIQENEAKTKQILEDLRSQIEKSQIQEQGIFKSKTTRMFPDLKHRQQEAINKAEENLYVMQEKYQAQEKKKINLLQKVKYQNQEGKSFNGSVSPRFKHQTQQYAILANNNCPILGPNISGNNLTIASTVQGSIFNQYGNQTTELHLTLKGNATDYKQKLGPGSYDPQDGIFDNQSNSRNHQNMSQTSPFLSSKRNQQSYLTQAIQQKSFQGQIGQHHMEQPFIKKSFNAGIVQEQLNSHKASQKVLGLNSSYH